MNHIHRYVGHPHVPHRHVQRRADRGQIRTFVLEALVFAMSILTLLAWLGIIGPAVAS